MPNTISAAKALRQSKKRNSHNNWVRRAYRKAVKTLRENPSSENLNTAYSELDKAAKKGVIKKGKADRLKSRLTLFFAKKSA